MKKFQKWLLSLIRKRMEDNNEDGTFDKSLSAMEDAYGNLDSSSASAFDDFSNRLVSGWNKFTSGLDNWWKGFTGSGLTERDKQLNEMNMQNVEDTASRQVAGYNKAGINSALMYGNGASNSAPQTSATGGVGSMSDLMQVLMLPKQLKMMDAQTRNIEAQSEKTIADTEHVKQIIEWYPNVSEGTVAELWSKVGLNYQHIDESEAKEELARAEKVIKDAEGKFAEDLQRAKLALTEAQTQEAKDNALQSATHAAFEKFELDYAEANGARLSSSSILALVSALTSWFGISPTSDSVQTVVNTIADDVKHPMNMFTKGAKQAQKFGLDDRSIINKGKSLWNRFENWRNKEKRIRLFKEKRIRLF